MIARLFALLLVCACMLSAQATQPAAAGPSRPVIAFTFHLEGSDPERYSIAVDEDGAAEYTSHGPAYQAPGSVPHEKHEQLFSMSPATSRRIFELAKQLNYFNGNFEYTGSRIANIGKKTLTYHSRQARTSTTYNYSEHPALRELTNLFHHTSNVMESARRLTYLRRYDRLGLDKELKALQELTKRQQVAELQAIAPLLQELANDTTLMKMARQRAQKLLQFAVLTAESR